MNRREKAIEINTSNCFIHDYLLLFSRGLTNIPHAEIYLKYDAEGNHLKTGISKDSSSRHSEREIDGGDVVVIGNRSREKAAKTERFMVERNPGPDNNEPWAGKRNPDHPNYDPDYIPRHMRKE